MLGIFVPISTLWRFLTEKHKYSMQVCYEAAKQRDENERNLYKNSLESLVTSVDQVVFIDETHKDRNSSRKRKAWGNVIQEV